MKREDNDEISRIVLITCVCQAFLRVEAGKTRYQVKLSSSAGSFGSINMISFRLTQNMASAHTDSFTGIMGDEGALFHKLILVRSE